MSEQDYPENGQTPAQPNRDTNLELDELHMRETLGLSGRGRIQARQPAAGAPKHRHRFVQDGEVQVIHMSGLRDTDTTAASRGRIATLEAALEAEQAARTKAEHAAHSALAQMHALETKLAHVEMAAREALAAERQARQHAETELQAAAAARDSAREELTALAAAAPRPPKERVKSAPRAPKQPRSKEPQPVKWWLGKANLRVAEH